jgi:DNA-binding NtrC family response regulator
VVTFAVSPDKLGAGARRLLVVAARLIGSTLSRMREVEQVRDETADLRRQAIGSARSFLGQSPAAEHVAKLLPKLAASEASVLISGESGTGKTFVARLIHEAGPRAREPLRILAGADADPDVVRLPANLAWLEARAIEAALRASGGNRTRAAALLGINRATLYKKREE